MNRYDLAITFINGLGVRGIAQLIEHFGSAEAVFNAPEQQLKELVRQSVAEQIISKQSFSAADREAEQMQKHGIKAVAATDDDYPPLLAECPDRPHVLYYMGDILALSRHTVAMVGTRQITVYGQTVANRLVADIAASTPSAVIVSGLAFGVDSIAHRTAIDNSLLTAAVIPSSLYNIVPAENQRLARQIVESGGVLVSEYCSLTRLNGDLYIPRNRLIAGVSEGTIVVESPFKGGALTTAEFADGYQRSVMAVPGRVNDKCSAGANALICNRKAQMIRSGGDVVRELGWPIEDSERKEQNIDDSPMLTDDERKLLSLFRNGETLDLDTIAQKSGIPIGELNSLLTDLELGGQLRRLPARRYERC